MKEYIASILDAMTKFPEVAHVHIIPSEGSIEASAMGKEKVIMVKITSSAESLPAPMCLGNLKYLQKILSVDQIKTSGTLKFTIGDSLDKQTQIVRSIDFQGPRVKIRYDTTDPKASDVTNAPTLKSQGWDCSIKLQPSHSKEFNDSQSLQKLIDPTKSEFKINVTGGVAMFDFDGIELSITDEVQGEFPEVAGGYYLNSSRFASALSLASGADFSTMSFSKNAAKLEFQLAGKEYLVVIPKNSSPTR